MTDLITAEEAQKMLEGTTPGPWEACGDGRRVKPVPLDLFFAPIAETHQAIRWVDGNWQHEGGEVANARLIAAAPDLARTVIALHAELAQARADAQAEVALVVEKAAAAAGTYCWNRYATREEGGRLSSPAVFTSHTHQDIVAAIRALADVDGLAELAKLRELLDAVRAQRDKAIGLAETFEADRDRLTTENAALEENVRELVKAGLSLAESMRAIRDNTPSLGAKVVSAAALREWDAALAAMQPAEGE